MSRGPAEAAPPPPVDLAARDLPLTAWHAGSTVLRVHRRIHGPVHFSPGPGNPPFGRFDSAAGRFGVLYAACSFEGAFAETVLRNPARSLVSLGEIEARAVSTLAVAADIRLVDLTGPGLSRLGLDTRFLSGGYDACGAWADALHDHPSRPAGLAYPSRFDPSQICVALFDRIAGELAPVSGPTPLADRSGDVAGALDRYGKALDAGPAAARTRR